jgi:hypothetical protein
MRILTLVTNSEAAPAAVRLAAEFRSFNAEIDFRLRFLHIEMDAVVYAAPGVEFEGGSEIPESASIAIAAARLALILSRERPAAMVSVGTGELQEAAAAAAIAAGIRFARFCGNSAAEGEIDLGTDPAIALDRLTGVAREIR